MAAAQAVQATAQVQRDRFGSRVLFHPGHWQTLVAAARREQRVFLTVRC